MPRAQWTLDGKPVRQLDAAAEEVLDVPFQGFYGARAVACPEASCLANAGAGCKRPSGHSGPLVEYHAARRQLAARIRLVGLSCQECSHPDGPGSYVCPVVDSPEARELGIAGRALCRPCVVRIVPNALSQYD